MGFGIMNSSFPSSLLHTKATIRIGWEGKWGQVLVATKAALGEEQREE
jgi:hypothetical protein